MSTNRDSIPKSSTELGLRPRFNWKSLLAELALSLAPALLEYIVDKLDGAAKSPDVDVTPGDVQVFKGVIRSTLK